MGPQARSRAHDQAGTTKFFDGFRTPVRLGLGLGAALLRGFAFDALEHWNGAPAPNLHARAAIDAFEEADVFDRQNALLALVAGAARAADDGRFGRHNAVKFAAQR